MLSLRTSAKIKIAKTLYFFVKLFYKNNIRTITRNGINFEVDLSEGIDLHLFLFGGFQEHIYSNSLINLTDDAVIFDVGGNVGIMSLFFASKVKKGNVFAFEPTDYALKKFHKNLELNPTLAERIEVHQHFIYSSIEDEPKLEAYSSWKLTGSEKRHSVHKGIAKSAEDVSAITLDYFIEKKGINRLDLIKIDTDGYELEVLKGGEKLLSTLRPKVIFEIGLYIMKEKRISYLDYQSLFSTVNYKIFNTKGVEVSVNNFEKLIPSQGTVDLIAVPN
jgi:FkbM family methyltransferase